MAVKIVTDSTSDLTPEIAKELDITVVPLYIHFGDEIYRSGLELSSNDFFDRLVKSKNLPTTSAPSPGDFLQVYDKLSRETDEILAITISSGVSATYYAAAEAKNLWRSKTRLEVLDSFSALMMLGLVVISAAKAAKAGKTLDEVINVARSSINRVQLRLAFDTLEYLKKGGRIGAAQAWVGSLLNMNPILTLKDGKTEPVTRLRSRTKAVEYLCEFASKFPEIEEVAVEDATSVPGYCE
jgi:DegV family protein with EDD domain